MKVEITRRSLLLAGPAISAVALRPLMANGQDAATAPEKPAKKYQAKAPKTQPVGADAFQASHGTTIPWLGAAGFFLNSQGTTLMIDPLPEGFDMPVMIDMPIRPKDVPHLDAVLITHSDTDHYSVVTCRDLKPVCRPAKCGKSCQVHVDAPEPLLKALGSVSAVLAPMCRQLPAQPSHL